jgi:hypothetical protein
MSKGFIKERDYVCTPQNFSIKLVFDNKTTTTKIIFYDGNVKCFDLRYSMSMTDDKEHFDHLLEYVLDSVVNQLTKKQFQDFIIDGQLLGLNFYDLVKFVKSRSGRVIWTRR